uniref:Uncharacterized protein n=1 Tax=Tanacetum cinerariifolium TaxID=118510 RepID=A0A6L2NAE8_TANCI|nr:hypothetical protein [Tanacetum cinerariifolium]
MIAVNNWRDSGPKVLGALFKKRQNCKSKKPPTKTKETSIPKPTEGSEQSHSISSGTVPDPQDLERNIQLASTRLPSTLNEGTYKSQPLPEGNATHPEDSSKNIQPFDRGLTSMTSDEGTSKTTPRPEGSLEDKDSGETNHPLIWNQSTLLLLIFEALVLTVNYANLKASIDDYYDENIAYRDQTNKLVAASMSSLDNSRTVISDLYIGLNVITELLKEINNAVKDDPAINKKISEATKSFSKISTNITKAHALKQDEKLASYAKSSTNMAWNLGSRISGLKRAQNHIQSCMSSLKEDTHSIKSMMTEMYEVFKGQSSLAPSATPRINKGKGTEIDSDEDPSKKLMPASTIVHPDPDEEVKVPYTINQKMYYLTNKEMQAYLDKEEKVKKAAKEARILAISKHELREINPKKKNAVVKDLMNSLSQRYERIRKFLGELGIKSALLPLAPAPKQASSKSLRKKRKHMELEPEIRIPGLECNRALLENVPFINNMVVEEPEY